MLKKGPLILSTVGRHGISLLDETMWPIELACMEAEREAMDMLARSGCRPSSRRSLLHR